MVNVAKRSEREALLLQTLLTAKTLDTAQAMSLLNVSESTARRLFAELEQQNLVIRKYGGIQLAQNGPYDYSFEPVSYTHLPNSKISPVMVGNKGLKPRSTRHHAWFLPSV